MMRLHTSVIVAAAVVSVFTGRAKGQALPIYATHYVGNDGGSWTAASDWADDTTNNPRAPSPQANVTINNGHTPVTGGGQVLTLNIGAGSGLTLSNATLEILGYPAIAPTGNFGPGGTITLQGTSTLKYDNADTAAQPVTFNGGGRVIGQNNAAQIIGNIRNVNTTFGGGGHVSQYPYWVQNNYIFDADAPGLTMSFNPGLLPNAVAIPLGGGYGVYAGLSNAGGTIRATNGGRVLLSGGAGGYDNTGGTIAAAGVGSVVSLSNTAVVSGGALDCSGGGTFRVDSGQIGYVDAVFNTTTRFLVADQAQLLIIPLAFTNNGVITVGSATSTAGTVLQCATGYGNGPSQTYTGTGSVVLASDFAEIDCAGGTLTNGSGHTLRGFGKIQPSYAFTNNGTVVADQVGKTLYTAALTNTGTVRAESGGILVRGAVDTDQTAGGTMTATGTGSQIRLTGANIVHGGTIFTTSGGVIRIGDPSNTNYETPGVDSLTLNADVRVSPAKDFRLLGTVTNNGTITAEANATAATRGTISLASNAILAGTGSIVLTADGATSGQLGTAGFNYGPNTQNAGHTIRGTGSVTVFDFANAGTVRADVSGKTLYFNANGGSVSGLVNTGLLEATGGGQLQLDGKYTVTTGTVRANGGTVYGSAQPTNFTATTLTGGTWEARANSTLRIDGANIVTNSAAIILDGANARFTKDAAGTSALAGLTTNTGSLAVRNGASVAVGTLTNDGAATVVGGTLRIVSTAATPLAGTGGIDIQSGQVVFDYTGGTTPAAAIRGILATARAGNFATGRLRSTTATAARGLGYIDAAGAVTVRTALYGDGDLDGGVSINDFNAFAGNFGKASAQVWNGGDFDYDGGVSINDFNLLAGNFGQSLPASSASWAGLLAFAATHDDLVAFEAVTGVPEPTEMAILLAAASLGIRRRLPLREDALCSNTTPCR